MPGLGLALLVGACGGSTATPADATAMSDAATMPSDDLIANLAGKRILWIGAHPDDESTIAPILGEACVDQHAICSFLVLTRGESGNCARPDGCLPDLVTVRMQRHGRTSVRPASTAVPRRPSDSLRWFRTTCA